MKFRDSRRGTGVPKRRRLCPVAFIMRRDAASTLSRRKPFSSNHETPFRVPRARSPCAVLRQGPRSLQAAQSLQAWLCYGLFRILFCPFLSLQRRLTRRSRVRAATPLIAQTRSRASWPSLFAPLRQASASVVKRYMLKCYLSQ